MSQKWLLVQHLSDISTTIKKPLQKTQRIKFTCFDVSQRYMVFGATSGSIYVFQRDPASIVSIVPCKGSVVQLAISKNEKYVALANQNGMIVLVQNCFGEGDLQYQVFTEHQGCVVTAMKWHSDELYCGDNNGKVSLLTIPNVLSKAMLQVPCSSLMQLDSNIVQIDCYSAYILISTHTRTFICNTDKEQYRQVGKKLRNLNIGACFFSEDVDVETASYTKRNEGLFKNMRDDENFSSQINDKLKIFCGRPKAQLWVAKLDGSVNYTVRLKTCLKEKSSNIDIIQLKEGLETKIDERSLKNKYRTHEEPCLDFSKFYLFKRKYIFTFNFDGFYVFDPENSHIVCYCNSFNRIKDVRVIDDFIYIWNCKDELVVLTLYDLERCVTKFLFEKRFITCAELCIRYKEDILKLIETSDNIHIIQILKEKLPESTHENLLQQLSPLLEYIKDFTKRKFVEEQKQKGIVFVHNAYSIENDIPSQLNKPASNETSPLQNLKEFSSDITEKITESTKTVKVKFQVLEKSVKNLTQNGITDKPSGSQTEIAPTVLEQPIEELDEQKKQTNLKIFWQRYELSNINKNLEMAKFDILLATNNLSCLLELFTEFEKFSIAEKGLIKEVVELWSYRQYLKHLSKRENLESELMKLNINDPIILYMEKAFVVLNLSTHLVCQCSYPLPSAKNSSVEFYSVSCRLLDKFKDKPTRLEEICKKVPFMWKYVIKELKYHQSLETLLPLMIQFGDENVLSTYLKKFTYDTWDNAIRLVIKLGKRKCVNCDNKFVENDCDTIKWTNFAILMVQSMGALNTLSLLKRYSGSVPPLELEDKFYQTCIFATVIENARENSQNKAVALAKHLNSKESTAFKFEQLVGEFLQSKLVKRPNTKLQGTSTLKQLKKTDIKCTLCDLPIDIPIFKYNLKLNCDHQFHYICLQSNNNVCNLCK